MFPRRHSGRLGGRRRLLVAAVVLLLLVGLDLARAPRYQLTARGLVAAIHLYQATLSPVLGHAGVRCRFRPTCSHYAVGAIEKYGTLQAALAEPSRALRCGPWTPAGTVDPP